MDAITIPVGGSRPYEVRIGPGLLRDAAARTVRWSRKLLLSDENVAPLYAARVGLPQSYTTHLIQAGEPSKSFAELEHLLDRMAQAELDRRSSLVALGGGVVGDLGGLAAALYMRGIDCVMLPTTLLSQVDSSVGGKTAINLRAGKNLAGAFHPPALVLADTQTLATLDEQEFRSGLGEVIKTAVLAGGELLQLVEEGSAALRNRDPEFLAAVVAHCVRHKAGVVERDERESGERALLNLGHTFAHAIEQVAGFGTIPHGVAVGVGLCLALDLSRRLGRLEDASLPQRIRECLHSFGMPASIAELQQRHQTPLPPAALADAMRLDKKSVHGGTRFVLPLAAGKCVFGVEADPFTLAETLGA
jgi:3-dehydroquinate synthase